MEEHAAVAVSGPAEASSSVAETTITIVGAGPIGLELAMALRINAVPFIQLEAGSLASTIEWYPPQTCFHSPASSIALEGFRFQTSGAAPPTREEYLAYLRAAALHHRLNVRTHERVTRLSRTGAGSYELQTQRLDGVECRIRSDYVVLATGGMHAPRMLGIPGEELAHVSHYFQGPHPYFQRRLLVVGGGNSAVEAALRCANAGAEVTLCHRSAALDTSVVKPWLVKDLDRAFCEGRIALLPNTRLERIEPRRVELARSDMTDGRSVRFERAADFVLLMTGYVQKPDIFQLAGIETSGPERKPLLNDAMRSSDPGVYVVGTATAGTQHGKFRTLIETCHAHVPRVVKDVLRRTRKCGQALSEATALPGPDRRPLARDERLRRALAGMEVDRPPASFWLHFPAAQRIGRAAIEAHVEYARETGVDFLKVMNEQPYQPGVDIRRPEDWRKLRPAPLSASFFQEQLRQLDALLHAVPDNLWLVTTIRNPLQSNATDTAGKLASAHLREDPQAVSQGLSAIAESLAHFAEACIAAGAKGIYFSAKGGESERLPEDVFLEHVRPHDLTVLQAIEDMGELNLLHICGTGVRLHNYRDYPAHAVNWAVDKNALSLAEGRELFGRTVVGGLDNRGVMVDGSPQRIASAVRRIVAQHGPRGLIVGADCTLPTDIDWSRVRTAVTATELWDRDAPLEATS